MKNSIVRYIGFFMSLVLLTCPVTVIARGSFLLRVDKNSATTISNTEEEYPVVVVNGLEHNNLYSNPNSDIEEKVFPPDTMISIVEATISYILSGESYQTAFPDFIDQILAEDFKCIYCNSDGMPKTDVGVKKLKHALSFYKKDEILVKEMAGDLGIICAEKVGFDKVYVFSYDWRYSPMDLAGEFNDFLHEVVMKETGARKVNILAEGMGANVTSAFLNKYEKSQEFSEIENYVLVNSAAQGMSSIGVLYSCDVNIDPNGTIRWANDRADKFLRLFDMWLSSYILNQEEDISSIVKLINTYLIREFPRLYDQYIREMLCYNAGLWGLIPYDEEKKYYELAKEKMFFDNNGNSFNIDSHLEKKINEYHDVQCSAGDVLRQMQLNGVKVAIVSGYDLSLPPLIYGFDNGISETSDGMIDTKYSSFGATCAILCNDKNNDEFLDEQLIEDGHKHTDEEISENNRIKVDASTCALPENTWFIKGLMNDYVFSDASDAKYLITSLVFSVEQRDVHPNEFCPQNGWFPQFLLFHCFNDGHKWENGEDKKQPTCEDDGIQQYSCAVCNAIKRDHIPAIGHKWGDWEEYNENEHIRVCANDSSHIETSPHNWNNGKTVIDAAPGVEGKKIYVCKDCAAVKIEPIEALPVETEAPTTETPTTEAPTATEPAQNYTLGDVNMDGKINSADARLALRAAAKVETLSELQTVLADVSEDGKVKAADARTILRISARLEPKPEKQIPAA